MFGSHYENVTALSMTVMSKLMASWLSTPIPMTIPKFYTPLAYMSTVQDFSLPGFLWVLVSASQPLGIDGLGSQLWTLPCSFLLCSSSRRRVCCSLMQSLKACTCGWHCRQSWCWAMHSCTAQWEAAQPEREISWSSGSSSSPSFFTCRVQVWP